MISGRTQSAPAGFNYTHIAANGTFTIFALVSGNPSGPLGLFAGISINNPGTTWVLTVYDGSAAQNVVIAIFSPTVTLPPWPNPVGLSNGLTVVASGATPGDATVAWL